MSHDRKPGRARIVKADGGASGRGKGKGASGGAKAGSTGGSSGRGGIVLILLFLLAAIGSGVAVEVYLPS